MSITRDVWPLQVPLFTVRCVVCQQFTPTVFAYDWIAFLKSASSFDFEQWKKRSQRMKRNRHRRQVYLSVLTMCPARVPGHLKIDGWCTIRAGRYKRTVLLISLLVIIYKILYSTIFKQSISYRLVFIISFCPDRDHRKGVIKVLTASTLLIFFWTAVECEHARAASGKVARNEGWLIYFSPYYWCSCVSISFIFSIIP